MIDREAMLRRMQELMPFSVVADHVDHFHLQPKGAGSCDFCEEPIVVEGGLAFEKVHDARDVTIQLDGCPPFHSRGAWSACPTCAAFIDANDRAGLLDHAAKRTNDSPQETQDRAQAHAAFFEAKKP